MKNAVRNLLPVYRDGTRTHLSTKTRIMATVGPSVRRTKGEYGHVDEMKLRNMALEGASLFRVNAAHLQEKPDDGNLSYEEARQVFQALRRLRIELRRVLPVYFDLGGPKIRVSDVVGLGAKLEGGAQKPKLQPEIGDSVDLYLATARREAEFGRQSSAEARKRAWRSLPEVERFYSSSPGALEGAKLLLKGDIDSFERLDRSLPVNLKDGWCRLRVESIVAADHIRCSVEYVDAKFRFQPGQGANPEKFDFPRVITDKDAHDIDFAVSVGADVLSLSFVCAPEDRADLQRMVDEAKARARAELGSSLKERSPDFQDYLGDHRIPLFAKIETAFAVDPNWSKRYAASRSDRQARQDPLQDIVKTFDGVMVARGDLAVEVEKYAVPELQRQIIRTARRLNKPVIVATEMLESMKGGNASTRAEISDINTAVHQEADILMLSGETSAGSDPTAVVAEMRRAIEQAERELREHDLRKRFEAHAEERRSTLEALHGRHLTHEVRVANASQVCQAAITFDSEAILVSFGRGSTAREIAFFRPWQRVIAIGERVLTAVELTLHRGLFPVVTERPLHRTIENFIDIANEVHNFAGIPAPDSTRERFLVPGLVRIDPRFPDPRVQTEADLRRIIHVFTLPRVPVGAPEVERKYVISADGYQRLAAGLKADAESWRLLRQDNWYFADSAGTLLRDEVSVRLRREEIVAESASGCEGSRGVRSVSYYFTIKGPSRNDGSLEATRPEEEHDVTRGIKVEGWGNLRHGGRLGDKIEVPDWYRRRVVELHPGEGRDIESLQLRSLGGTTNMRLSAAMYNDFVIELDATEYPDAVSDSFRTLYEVEIETRNDPKTGRMLDEYLADKCSALGIRIVRVDRGSPISALSERNLKYPAKYLQFLASSGQLDEVARTKVHEAIEIANAVART